MAFNFGGAPAPAAGAPAPAPAAGGFNFGGAPAPAAGGFNFGGAPASAPAPAGGGFSFGGATPAPAPATTPAAATPAPAATGAFGGFGAAAPAPATTPAPAATTAPAPAATGAFGGFGAAAPAPAPATTPAPAATAPAPATTPAAAPTAAGLAGLGGFGVSATTAATPATTATTTATAATTANAATAGTPGTFGTHTQGLGGGGGGGGGGGLRRSLHELGVASTTLGGGAAPFPSFPPTGNVGGLSGGQGALSYASEAAAHRLLARSGRGFDSAQFGRDARELETRSHTTHTHAHAAAQHGGMGGGGMGLGTMGGGAGGQGGGTMPQTPWGVKSGLLGADASTFATSARGGGSGGSGVGVGVATPPTASVGGIGMGMAGRAGMMGSTSTTDAALLAASAPDLSTYLSHHAASTVQRILATTRQNAERTTERLVAQRLRDDWHEERIALARGSGLPNWIRAAEGARDQHQALLGGGMDGGENVAPNAALRFGTSGVPTPAAMRRRGVGGDITATATGGAGALIHVAGTSGNGGTATLPSTKRVTNFAAQAAQVTPPAPLNAESGTAHLRLVMRLNESRKRTASAASSMGSGGGVMKSTEMMDEIQQLLRNGVSTYDATGTNTAGGAAAMRNHPGLAAIQSVDRGYGTALDVVGSLVAMAEGNGTGRNFFARVRSAGSLANLSDQYRGHILAQVRSSAMSGAAAAATASTAGGGGGGGDGFADDVATYVNLELGRVSGTGTVSGSAVSPWRKLYRCLRAGDMVAALSTASRGLSLGSSSDDDAVSAVLAVVKSLAQFQGAKRSIWDAAAAASSGGGHIEGLLSAVSPDAVGAVVEHYRTAGTVSQPGVGGEESLYRLACLSLLSLGASSNGGGGADAAGGAGSSAVAATVEDYLYEALWGAFFQQSDEACAAAVSNLGASVQHFGPSHFEEENETAATSFGGPSGAASSQPPLSGGWAFAVPLLFSQQFESALTYLSRVGGLAGLLQATHLALVMHLAGIRLVDLSDGNSSPTSSSGLLTSLLSSYASTLQEAAASLEYLVLIPDTGGAGASSSLAITSRTAKSYVQRLILDTRAFEILAGVTGPDGKRVHPSKNPSLPAGALDCHFSSADVSNLLAGAADDALRRGNVNDAAELLDRAGKYVALLSVLNSELASLLVVEDTSNIEIIQRREFWRQAADTFDRIHLRGGPNHVTANLEAENRLDVGATFKLIMNLMIFFNRCQSRDWEGAWAIMNELGLFPSTEDEMSRKVSNYQMLDVVLKDKPFRHAVLGSMESLYQQHSSLKVRLGSAQTAEAAGAINQQLGSLRSRARLLITFSGLCRLDGDLTARIARTEAYMV